MFGDQSGHVNVTGGTVTQSFSTIATSTATITGGDFGSASPSYGVYAVNNSVIDFGGNAVTRTLQTNGNSLINVTGGTIADLNVGRSVYDTNNSIINLYGGNISQNTIRVFGSGVLNVHGRGLALSSAIGTGVEPNGEDYTEYLLTGTLQNGQVLNTRFRDFQGGFNIGDPGNPNGPNSPLNFFAGIAAAPEPSALALLLCGVGAMAGVVRRRQGVRK